MDNPSARNPFSLLLTYAEHAALTSTASQNTLLANTIRRYHSKSWFRHVTLEVLECWLSASGMDCFALFAAVSVAKWPSSTPKFSRIFTFQQDETLYHFGHIPETAYRLIRPGGPC